MSNHRLLSAVRLFGLCLSLLVTKPASAKQVWNGPTISYRQPGFDSTLATNQDRLTGNVWLSRDKTHGLFNARTEGGYGLNSPADTEWAYGNLTNHSTLTYAPWETWNGHFPPSMVGQDAVLHLISEDIYLAINFTFWGRQSAGGFGYTRSTPPVTAVDTPGLTPPLAALLALLLGAAGWRALRFTGPDKAGAANQKGATVSAGG